MVTHDRLTDFVTRQFIGLVLGPSLFAAVLLFPPFDISTSANAAFESTLWIALWWVTEAIPIPATSLLPIVLFPLTGVVGAPAATSPYADPVVFLLLGGFLLALGIERWGLHRRIALTIMDFVGVRSDRLLLGLMVATAFLSMWISNSATATVFMPIMISLGLTLGVSTLMLMATTALAASMAFMLPVATPPNAVVFGSGYVTIPKMSRIGLWLNLLAIVAISVLTYLWLPVAFAFAG